MGADGRGASLTFSFACVWLVAGLRMSPNGKEKKVNGSLTFCSVAGTIWAEESGADASRCSEGDDGGLGWNAAEQLQERGAQHRFAQQGQPAARRRGRRGICRPGRGA